MRDAHGMSVTVKTLVNSLSGSAHAHGGDMALVRGTQCNAVASESRGKTDVGRRQKQLEQLNLGNPPT